ncbi:MAG: DUF1465 family protein [Hyphomicrobiaceae bacterium]|nr:DUF1465 family protein [Hyphomicrobiaceae bacterium]
MGSKSSICNESGIRGVTVSFGQHFAASEQFDCVFKQGMELVERTAAYLDGPGRRQAKALKPLVAHTYATESMRLTTRLLDLASWLLVRRSLKEGEITEQEARSKRSRIKLRTSGRPTHIPSFAELPEDLRRLIEESFALSDRIVRIDRSLHQVPESGAPRPDNPVAAQISKLQAAFAAAVR